MQLDFCTKTVTSGLIARLNKKIQIKTVEKNIEISLAFQLVYNLLISFHGGVLRSHRHG